MAETGDRIAPDARFVLSAKDVVAETFPDETVAVNLATGRYYSLDLPSAVAFELVTTGHSIAEVATHLAAVHGADVDVVEGAIATFVQQLMEQELVVVADPTAPSLPLPPPTPTGEAFCAPTVAVYSDMEDLLLLDPIHDVDETGWPVRADVPAADPGHAPDES